MAKTVMSVQCLVSYTCLPSIGEPKLSQLHDYEISILISLLVPSHANS